MKKIFFTLLLLALTVTAGAVPPEHRLQTLTQPDGTQIQVYRHGEWRTDFFTTLDGRVLVRGLNKGLYYAETGAEGLQASAVLAHELDGRTQAELDYLKTHSLNETVASKFITPLKTQSTVHRIIGSSTSDGLGKYGVSGVGAVPSIGDLKIPVIMVEFSDKKFRSTTTIEKMTRYYNEEGYTEDAGCVGSCRDYFIAQSNGMFRPEFVVVAKVTLGNNYSYYGSNDNSDGYYDVTRDAVSKAKSQGVDFSQFEVDGAIPLVSIFYAGCGEATGGDDDCLWPCEAEINASLSGYKFKSCFIGNEIYGDVNSTELQGIGVFCHEFSHALGLPDLYCTNYSHSSVTMGYWSLMASGCYVPDGRARAPMGYTAYERSNLGWLDIPELTAADSVSLHPFGSTEGPNAVLIRNDNNQREYFILENHQPGTWSPSSYGRGLFVTHVTFNADAWRYNNLNNDDTKLRCTFIPASGTRNGHSSSDLFPYGSHTSLGPNTTPAMRLYDGKTLNKPIYKITVREDSLVTFNYLDENFKGHNTGDIVSDDNLRYRFVSTSQVEVIAPESGSYSGNVTIPSYYIDGSYRYRVVGVADGAFADAAALTYVDMPATIKSIASTAFRNSPNLHAVSVDTGNVTYYTSDGVLYSKSEMISSPETALQPLSEDHYFDIVNNPWQFDAATNRLRPAGGQLTDSIIVSDVTLVGIDASASKFVFLLKNSNGECNLYVPTGCGLRFYVPDNLALDSISFTATSTGLSLTPSNGTITNTSWNGNTREVIFTATANTQLSAINVTTTTTRNYSEPVVYYFPQAKTGSYTVPFGVSRLGDYAFEHTGLSQLTLSDSLTEVGVGSLSSENLTSLICKTMTPPSATGDPFTLTTPEKCTLIVPTGAEPAYQAASFWQKFYGKESGISGVAADGAVAGPMYDLQGRRITAPRRGLYIISGRKVLVP